jgi:hypothetical protein
MAKWQNLKWQNSFAILDFAILHLSSPIGNPILQPGNRHTPRFNSWYSFGES